MASSLSDDVRNWSDDDVRNWAIGTVDIAVKYADMLVEQEIDGTALLLMTEEKLERYGIPGGPASKLFAAIQQLGTYLTHM